MTRAYTYDMTKGNPTKLLLRFAGPMLVGNMFQQLYNMADAMIVGNFVGDNELGAVGATGPISFLIFSLCFGLSSGIGIIVSQFFGANDEEKVKKTIATALYVMLGSALMTTIIGVIVARPIMTLLGTPDIMLDNAVMYLQITSIGVLAISLYNGVASILRALGDSKTPLIFLAVACIMNIGLDLLFIIEFHMGVFGAALATIIAQFVAGIGCMIFAWIKVPVFRMPIREYVIDKGIYVRCIRVGVPVALQSSLISISCVVLQRVVNSFGPTIVSAFTAECRFEQLVQQPFSSLGAALAAYTGQNIGAGNIKRVKQGFWSATIISTIFSISMLPIAWFGGEMIMRLFTDNVDVIREGAIGIRITCLFYSALGMIYVTRNVLNGAGDVKFAMYSGVVEVVSRVGFARPLTLIPMIGMLSIWFTTGFTWLLTAVVSCLRYKSGVWKNKGIVEHKKEIAFENVG